MTDLTLYHNPRCSKSRAALALLQERGITPRIVGEFDDSALMKAFGQRGAGVFVGPTVLEAEIRRQYGVKVLGRSDVLMYFGNSFIVTIASLFFILLFGAMAAWGLSEYQFKGNRVHEERPELNLLPSEFFKRNVYGCYWFEQTAPKHLIDYVGADNILISTGKGASRWNTGPLAASEPGPSAV